MGNLRWILNTLAKFRLDMIILTIICVKKEKTISSLLKDTPCRLSQMMFLPFMQFAPYFPGIHLSHAVPVKLAEHLQCPSPDIPSPHWPLLEQGLLR